MRKKNTQPSTNHRSMKILLLFCVVVVILIGISLSVRFLSTVKNSKFDGKHRLTLLVKQSDKVAEILSFEPQAKSITRVVINSPAKLPNIGKHFGIVIDGVQDDPSYEPTDNDLKGRLFRYSTKITGNGLTNYDYLRLYFFANSLQSNDIQEKRYTSLPETDQLVDLTELFYDATLRDEKIPIEIINASGVTGRGTALERVMSNLGANVVQVTTAPKDEVHSSIQYIDGELHTTKRIINILGFPAKKSVGDELSDIIIVIGKESVNHPVF